MKIRFEFKAALAYIVLGAIWIIFSDKLVNHISTDKEMLTLMQTIKGWLYVFITGLMAFYLIRNRSKSIDAKNEELKLEKERAELSSKQKTSYLSNMSHEIRTPINGIIGFSEMLDDEDLEPEDRQKFVKIIIKSGERLLAIVNNLIEISKIESGQMQAQKNPINLNLLMSEVFEMTGIHVKNKQVEFSYSNGLEDEDSDLITDPDVLKNIWINLVSNALKFTEKGHVKFGYKLENKSVKCWVEDTGIGIDKSTTEAIFERYRQADPTIKKSFGGTGLGLAISKGYAQLLGGELWVESELGKGSTFYFTFPYQHTEPFSEISGSVLPNNISLDWSNRTILIAEDIEENFLYLETLIEKNKAHVLRANNGQEAVEMVKENNIIDLVLMDIKMPELNGKEAMLQIKAQFPEMPVIAQSAYGFTEEKDEAIKDGFDYYLTKPVRKDELYVIVNKFIHRKKKKPKYVPLASDENSFPQK